MSGGRGIGNALALGGMGDRRCSNAAMDGSGTANGRGREEPLSKLRLGTYFSGGGGVDWGLRNAGLEPVWAVEYDADIAAVYERNFGHSPIIADVRTVDPAELPPVDWFHASPVCTRASVANTDGEESEDDIQTAAAVSRALTALEPAFFTLENVVQYRKFKAFGNICKTLDKLGYFWTADNVNSADFGVPQTRRRLIVRASRGLLPPLPLPERWIGWYEAIEDLIPTLPESKLAPWQLARLPEEIKANILLGSQNTKQEFGKGYKLGDEPSMTITADQSPRALLLAGDSNADSWGDNYWQAEQPAFTAKENGVGSQRVIVAEPEAVLVAGLLNDRSKNITLRAQAEPAFTVTTQINQRDIKAALPGYKVVSITPRCLARFQSVPDQYWLPEKRGLAAKVIGNMVPPLLMQRLAEGMLA